VSHGFPGVRMQAIKRFADAGGYNIVLDILRHESYAWPGGDVLLVLLKSVNTHEVRDASTNQTCCITTGER
jgi:hypothetical protein